MDKDLNKGKGKNKDTNKPSSIEDEMKKSQEVLGEKPYLATLISADQDKRHIKIALNHPPTTTIVLENKKSVFLFSQIQRTEEGDVFIYVEASAILFDIELPQESTDHGTH